MIALLLLPLAYLLGAIPFGYLLVKWKTGGDVRASGSGNIGATNVLRTTGRVAGFATLLLDIAKGYAAVWIAGRVTGDDPVWTSLAMLAVIAGHAFPVFLGFRGGKAVASFVGALLYLAPKAMAAEVVVFVVVVLSTRYISLGSIIGAATVPLAVWLLQQAPIPVILASAAAGAFIIYKHSGNVRRVRAGTEHTFTLGAGKR
jgi:glycerol-3-phosphate acyltransferase PlsY